MRNDLSEIASMTRSFHEASRYDEQSDENIHCDNRLTRTLTKLLNSQKAASHWEVHKRLSFGLPRREFTEFVFIFHCSLLRNAFSVRHVYTVRGESNELECINKS